MICENIGRIEFNWGRVLLFGSLALLALAHGFDELKKGVIRD